MKCRIADARYFTTACRHSTMLFSALSSCMATPCPSSLTCAYNNAIQGPTLELAKLVVSLASSHTSPSGIHDIACAHASMTAPAQPHTHMVAASSVQLCTGWDPGLVHCFNPLAVLAALAGSVGSLENAAHFCALCAAAHQQAWLAGAAAALSLLVSPSTSVLLLVRHVCVDEALPWLAAATPAPGQPSWSTIALRWLKLK